MPENVDHNDESIDDTAGGATRRDFLSGLLALTGATALAAFSNEAEAQVLRITRPRVVEMPDHNMPDGFSRSKIVADVDGEASVIGSIFLLEDGRAKAEFISKKSNPNSFASDGRPDFDSIKSTTSTRGDKLALVAAGAFFTGAGVTQGVALEEGRMVGEPTPAGSLNGILVIKNGIPSIEYMNQISDFPSFLEQAKREGWSLLQQTSYIRPGGTFQSSNLKSYELRFFVEGQGKKAVINLSEKMTYTDALSVLENLAGFKIEKAIGLDTGAVSEARFYEANGQDHLMVDEQFGQGRGYTNVLALYSDS